MAARAAMIHSNDTAKGEYEIELRNSLKQKSYDVTQKQKNLGRSQIKCNKQRGQFLDFFNKFRF